MDKQLAATNAFRSAPEWDWMRRRWQAAPPAAAVRAGVSADEWIDQLQKALICLGRCVVAATDEDFANVLGELKAGFFSQDPRFHGNFRRFARRWSDLSRRHGEEVDSLLVEEAIRLRLQETAHDQEGK